MFVATGSHKQESSYIKAMVQFVPQSNQAKIPPVDFFG